MMYKINDNYLKLQGNYLFWPVPAAVYLLRACRGYSGCSVLLSAWNIGTGNGQLGVYRRRGSHCCGWFLSIQRHDAGKVPLGVV